MSLASCSEIYVKGMTLNRVNYSLCVILDNVILFIHYSRFFQFLLEMAPLKILKKLIHQ